MPYTPEADRQKHFRDRTHPLNQVLQSYAASGAIPTREELELIPGYKDDLTTRLDVNDAVKAVRTLALEGNKGEARSEARARIDSIGQAIAHRAQPIDHRPVESVADIGARMFRR